MTNTFEETAKMFENEAKQVAELVEKLLPEYTQNIVWDVSYEQSGWDTKVMLRGSVDFNGVNYKTVCQTASLYRLSGESIIDNIILIINYSIRTLLRQIFITKDLEEMRKTGE